MYKRWQKLDSDYFNQKTQEFNISKISDINDSIKYDLIHNFQFLDTNFGDLPVQINKMANKLKRIIVPLEYGYFCLISDSMIA